MYKYPNYLYDMRKIGESKPLSNCKYSNNSIIELLVSVDKVIFYFRVQTLAIYELFHAIFHNRIKFKYVDFKCLKESFQSILYGLNGWKGIFSRI